MDSLHSVDNPFQDTPKKNCMLFMGLYKLSTSKYSIYVIDIIVVKPVTTADLYSLWTSTLQCSICLLGAEATISTQHPVPSGGEYHWDGANTTYDWSSYASHTGDSQHLPPLPSEVVELLMK